MCDIVLKIAATREMTQLYAWEKNFQFEWKNCENYWHIYHSSRRLDNDNKYLSQHCDGENSSPKNFFLTSYLTWHINTHNKSALHNTLHTSHTNSGSNVNVKKAEKICILATKRNYEKISF